MCFFISDYILLTRSDCGTSNWRMTIAQVKESETAEYVLEDANNVLYSGTVANMKSEIFCQFVNNQLTKTGYFLTEAYTDIDRYIENYMMLKEMLTEEHGDPYR